MEKATHRFIENETITFKKGPVRFGEQQIKVRFESGEWTEMSERRFNELFKVSS